VGRPASAAVSAAAELLAVAEEAARAGAEVLVPRFGRERALASKSSPTDLVSEADLASERAIRAVLAARRPDDGVLGEEGTGDVRGSTGLRWVIDPLDGTIDFLYGIPQWCVSVAVEDDRGGVAGVVLDPLRDECFAAARDGGATLNGVPLPTVGERRVPELAAALVATGFGYDADVRREQGAVAARLLPEVRDIRRAGSAALDLVWTAAGRHDAYFEFGVQRWDVAAGRIVCAEVGLEVRSLPGGAILPPGIAAAPSALIEPLLARVAG
jgi:myo-inositol-1(or 4)-monophosphatase